jgi:hypothetical protein|tara:strand:- start:785 stop:1039 length:255 start_codon:yes stop_codon:yes gene_type:complete
VQFVFDSTDLSIFEESQNTKQLIPRKTRKFKLRTSTSTSSGDNTTLDKERFRLKSTRKSRGFSLTWLLIACVLLLIGIYILDTL